MFIHSVCSSRTVSQSDNSSYFGTANLNRNGHRSFRIRDFWRRKQHPRKKLPANIFLSLLLVELPLRLTITFLSHPARLTYFNLLRSKTWSMKHVFFTTFFEIAPSQQNLQVHRHFNFANVYFCPKIQNTVVKHCCVHLLCVWCGVKKQSKAKFHIIFAKICHKSCFA